jgi:hypothetical protein
MKMGVVLAGILLACASAEAAAQWASCAPEGGTCAFQGRREVAFGSGNKWITRNFSDGAKCTTLAFGSDPSPGVVKSCKVNNAVAASGSPWANCAREGAVCSFNGRKEVSYGSGNKWVSAVFSGGVKCINDSFLGDPTPGVAKACRVRDIAGASANPRWVRCAAEGQACKFSGDRNVAYGAGNRLKYRAFRNGAMCTTGNFGDPAPGAAKSCYYDAN